MIRHIGLAIFITLRPAEILGFGFVISFVIKRVLKANINTLPRPQNPTKQPKMHRTKKVSIRG
jgi:hypothetical protein